METSLPTVASETILANYRLQLVVGREQESKSSQLHIRLARPPPSHFTCTHNRQKFSQQDPKNKIILSHF